MRKVILHLGLHKTATKYLQRDVFPSLPGIEFLPKEMYERDLLPQILHLDELAFRDHGDAIRSSFLEKVSDSSSPLLISNELFSGNVFYHSCNRYDILLKLQRLFPEAKVILSIRGQMNLLDSLYREYVMQGGCATLEQFVAQPGKSGGSLLSYHAGLDPEAFRYGCYLDEISKTFGRDNCFFFPYERLVHQPDKLFRTLFDFLGVADSTPTAEKRHRSLSNGGVKALRFANRFFYSAMNHRGMLPHSWNFVRGFAPLCGDVDRRPLLDASTCDYRADNQYIDREYALNLAKDYSEYYFPTESADGEVQ